MVDATVYMMFLKGQRDRPDNKFIGTTIQNLDKKLKRHKKESVRVCGHRNSKLHKVMQETGHDKWEIAPLAELWLTTKKDYADLEKYYVELSKPDLV